MTLFLSEAEMLDRYVDGLRRSASRAGEFLSVAENKKLKLFVEFIEGIKVAAGSAHQLAHSQMNPKWLDARDILEGVIAMSNKIADTDIADEQLGPVWLKVQQVLNDMVDSGRKLATSKAMKWEDIISNLDHRAKNADILGKTDGLIL